MKQTHPWLSPELLSTGKSLLKAAYLTLGTFLILSSFFHVSRSFYITKLGENSTQSFKAGINQDLNYLKEQGDEAAKNTSIQESLLTNDSEKLTQLLLNEKTQRSIGLMSVTDSGGVVIGRTMSIGKLGENIFLTRPLGRVTAQGKSAQSIEATYGFDPRQIILTTGRPIIRDNHMIGALFASRLADDDYATIFRNNHLSKGVEVVFYNKNAGIYGNSFSDPSTRKLINSYFNSGSDWIKNGSSGKTISFKDGQLYLVENIIFPGLESSPGGALLFIPYRNISTILNLSSILITILTFLYLTLRQHRRSHTEACGWRYCLLVIGSCLLVIALSFSALHLQDISYLKLKTIPYPLYNSTLRLQPDFGIYDINFTQRFSIVVDTGDEAINTVDLTLTFDPQAINIEDLEVNNDTCSYVIEKTIDSEKGTITLVCALFQASDHNSSLTIADLVVKPKKTGIFSIGFDQDHTRVLASDGLGTNVLRSSQASSYRVDNFAKNLTSSTIAPTDTNARSFVVFSTSHPNQSRWYNKHSASFAWQGTSNAVYTYEFDNSPDTIPSKLHTTQNSSVDVDIPGDGIFYFHLQLASGGPIAHYRIQSDSTPPTINALKASAKQIFTGDVVRFSFDGYDIGSGIQKNYYIDLGNKLFLPIGSELFVPFLEAGEQKITLRVYDLAGNYSEKSQIITVQSKANLSKSGLFFLSKAATIKAVN